MKRYLQFCLLSWSPFWFVGDRLHQTPIIVRGNKTKILLSSEHRTWNEDDFHHVSYFDVLDKTRGPFQNKTYPIDFACRLVWTVFGTSCNRRSHTVHTVNTQLDLLFSRLEAPYHRVLLPSCFTVNFYFCWLEFIYYLEKVKDILGDHGREGGNNTHIYKIDMAAYSNSPVRNRKKITLVLR